MMLRSCCQGVPGCAIRCRLALLGVAAVLPEGQLGSAGVGVRSVGSAGIPFDAVVESAVERAFDAVDEPLIPGAALSFTPLWFSLARGLQRCRYPA